MHDKLANITCSCVKRGQLNRIVIRLLECLDGPIHDFLYGCVLIGTPIALSFCSFNRKLQFSSK